MKRSKTEQKRLPDRDPLHPEKKLVNRRDFLSSGVLGFSGLVTVPSVLEMVLTARAAKAGECPTGGAVSGSCPLLIFDCAGGAALPGNFPPMDSGGGLLPSYSALGLGDNASQWNFDKSFGAPMAAPILDANGNTTNTASVSQIYLKLTSMLPKNVQACLQMGTIAANSMSDSQTNMFSPLSLVTASGLAGSAISTGMGMTAAQSGGNSDWGSGNPAFKPMQINSVDALALALSYGPAFKGLPGKMLDTLASALIGLSGSQAKRFQSMNLGSQLGTLAQCGYLKNANNTGGVPGVDPRQDANAQSIYNINSGSAGGSKNVVFATLALNAIMGNSGASVFTIGGCDYHDGTQTSGDGKDAEIGTDLAQALNLAFQKNKKVAFIIYTDGGIYSDPNTRQWRGDDNQHGLAIFGVMDPAGKPTMQQTQIGGYTGGQVCDQSFTVGNDALKVCHALFLNYLAVCGKVDQYQNIVSQQDLTNATLLSALYPTASQLTKSLLLFPNAKG